MSISLGNAIKSLKEDEKWIKKVLIGGFVALFTVIASGMMESEGASIPAKIIGIGLYLLFGSFLSGFCVSTGNKMLNTGSNTMSEWSEPNLLLKGLKFLFSWIVYTIIAAVIFTLVSIVLFIVLAVILGLIYYLINLIFHTNILFTNILVGIIASLIGTVFILYYMQFINAAYVSYYNKLSFHDLIALKKQFRMIRENKHASWTLIGKEILYILLFLLIALILCITIVGIILLPFVYFGAFMVMTNLYAQFGREIGIGRYLE